MAISKSVLLIVYHFYLGQLWKYYENNQTLVNKESDWQVVNKAGDWMINGTMKWKIPDEGKSGFIEEVETSEVLGLWEHDYEYM